MPSVVVPRMPDRFRVDARAPPPGAARIAARWGAMRGSSQTTTASTFTGRQPRSRSSTTTAASSAMLSAPAKRRVGVGEVVADVLQAGRPEQRIHDGVRQHVGVAVAQQAVVLAQSYPAQHQRAVGGETWAS